MRCLLVVLAVAASCGSHDQSGVKPDRERQRRVIEPPSGRVRPLPPHAIRGDGVGPYKLGATLAELLDELPSGPRIAQFDIPGVVHRSILHAENDAILIGGEPLGRASFVAVLGPDIARTESGVHVGSTRDELVRGLGPPVDDPGHARDPRMVVPSGLRGARVVLDPGDRVAAIVVAADGDMPQPVTPRDAGVEPGCARPVDPDGKLLGACLTAGGERIAVDGDDVVVHGPDSDRVIAQVRVSGLVFVAPLRNPVDGRDELVAISRLDDAQARTWTLTAFRLEGGRLARAIDATPLYQLSAANARWIGAELRDLELYLELTARPDAIEVGGLLTSRMGDKLRDAVVISVIPAARRHAKSAAAEAGDAGIADAVDTGSPSKRP